MKVELHLHTSRYSACAVNTPREMISRLIETGYEAVYITEHDAVWSKEELDQLQAEFPDIRIFGGIERTLGSNHLLILPTTSTDYLAMNDPAEVLAFARREGHLTILAHPFRWEGGADMLERDLLPDAIEHCTCNQDDQTACDTAARAAKELNLPLVNSGDTHSLDFIDKYWIETLRPLDRADDISKIILDGAYKNHSRR